MSNLAKQLRYWLLTMTLTSLSSFANMQYDLSPIIDKSELTYKDLPLIDKFNVRFVKRIEKTHFCGDIQNGKGVIRIRIKQYLYRKDLIPQTYDIYIAGVFKNGKLNGETWIARISGYTKSSVKNHYIPALKRGEFAEANKDYSHIIHGYFKDNVMQWGTYKPYAETEVLLTYGSITPHDITDKHNLKISHISDYTYKGQLRTTENKIYVNAQPTDTIFRKFALKNEAGEWKYLEQNLYPSIFPGMFRMESQLYSSGKEPIVLDSSSELIYMVPGINSIYCSVKNHDEGFTLQYNVYDERFYSFDTLIQRKLEAEELLFGAGVYKGEVDAEGQPEGFGSYTSLSENHIGFFKNGRPNGAGMKKTKTSLLIGFFFNGDFVKGSSLAATARTRSMNKILDPTEENRHYRIQESKPEVGWYITNVTSINPMKGKGIYLTFRNDKGIQLKWEYEGELDENYLPHGVLLVNGEKGIYEHGRFIKLTDEQLASNAAEQQRLAAEERAKWLKESPCGVPGKWVKLSEIRSYTGRVFCTSSGEYATFSWVHENAQYWGREIVSTTSGAAIYGVSYPYFPNVTPGAIEYHTNGSSLHKKGDYIFLIDETPAGYYQSCTQCGGSGALTYYTTASNGIGNQTLYMRYRVASSWKDDFRTGVYLTPAKPQNYPGRIGLNASNNTYLPCEICCGMGCIALKP